MMTMHGENGHSNGTAQNLKMRAARALLKAEHIRSLTLRTLRGGDRAFSDHAAWQDRARKAGPRDHAGTTLSWAHRGPALEVALHREPCNEIGTSTLAELELLAEYLVEGAGGARALIFYSPMDTGFSAGADLRELHESLLDRRSRSVSLPSQVRELRSFLDRIHAVYDVFDTVPITTVSAVHGVVFGGGFELALTTDLIVADKTARFCFPELRLGLIPGWGGIPRLNRDLGNAVVRDLLLTGRSLRAKRAHEVGLVSQLVAKGEALNVARMVADQAGRFDRDTTQVAKAFLKPISRRELDREKELFTRLFASPVVETALENFVNSDDLRPYLP
jgi:enoyl-CoA hydratase/carnithine racemase